jgi:predicted transcriptional regulator
MTETEIRVKLNQIIDDGMSIIDIANKSDISYPTIRRISTQDFTLQHSTKRKMIKFFEAYEDDSKNK